VPCPMREQQARRYPDAPDTCLDANSRGCAVRRGSVHVLQQTKRRTGFDERMSPADVPAVLRQEGKLPGGAMILEAQMSLVLGKRGLHGTAQRPVYRLDLDCQSLVPLPFDLRPSHETSGTSRGREVCV